MAAANRGKTFTLITRAAPYGCDRPQLCLEITLAAAVFDQDVNYVFLGDGVLQLLKGQNTDAINCKSLENAFKTLELYGVTNVFVDEKSLLDRKLGKDDLIIEAQLIDDKLLAAMMENSHAVFNL